MVDATPDVQAIVDQSTTAQSDAAARLAASGVNMIVQDGDYIGAALAISKPTIQRS